jgi:hypothetical protein
MHPAVRAQNLGRQMGIEQRMEHTRLVLRVQIQDATLHELACLAWKLEPHVLKTRYRHAENVLDAFVAGYEQGYRFAEGSVTQHTPAS